MIYEVIKIANSLRERGVDLKYAEEIVSLMDEHPDSYSDRAYTLQDKFWTDMRAEIDSLYERLSEMINPENQSIEDFNIIKNESRRFTEITELVKNKETLVETMKEKGATSQSVGIEERELSDLSEARDEAYEAIKRLIKE